MKRKKAAAKRAVSQGLIVLGCLLICLIWVLPFLWMLGTSMEAGNRFLQPASGFLARAVEHRKLSEGF